MEHAIIYDVNFFIKKFEAIPENKWTVRIQQNADGQRCAFGHCAPSDAKGFGMSGNGGTETKEGVSLRNLFVLNIKTHDPVARINNGDHLLYQQPTPKQRILAALYDIKAMQEKEAQPTYTNISKQLAVLPVEETTDTVGKQVVVNN